jgi:sulfur-oxidizing protein SoxX
MRCLSSKPGRHFALVRMVITRGSAMAAALFTLSLALAGDEPAGKALAMERSKGNCLACHAFDDGQLPGNIGPPLVAMTERFPEREVLFRQIWDATERNPDSRMPPFGKHGILSDDEIERIVDYLYTL